MSNPPKKPLVVGNYRFGKTLGRGYSSTVKLGQNMDTGEVVAIKIVRMEMLRAKPMMKGKMRREISVLKLLDHPNICAIIDVFEIPTHLFIVMEFVDGMELFTHISQRGALPERDVLHFFQQIIRGLEYCHRRLICHRDMKPENILLDRHFNLKIVDFGMTSLSPPGELLSTSCGSPHYCDPMVISGGKYNGCKADLWSCGVILYALATGRLPFDDDNVKRLLKKVQAGKYHMPPNLPGDLKNLIGRMLTADPDQRITMQEITAHPWFNKRPYKPYVDNFIVPTASIDNPDPALLSSLVDVGWGNETMIREELSREGGNLLKVFYDALKNHRMSRQPRISQSIQGSASSNPPPPRCAPPTQPTPGSNLRSAAMANENIPPTTQPANINMNIESAPAATAGVPPLYPTSTNTATGQGDDVGRRPRQIQMSQSAPGFFEPRIVRQSSYTRLPGNGNETPRTKDPEEGIQSQVGPTSPSWFDSVRNYFARPEPATETNSSSDTAGGGKKTR